MAYMHRIAFPQLIIVGFLVAFSVAACSSPLTLSKSDSISTRSPDAGGKERVDQGSLTIRLTSEAFQDGEEIPRQYTCDGENISPPLAWENLPSASTHTVLIIDDPDAPAGIWTHWVVYNIPVGIRAFEAGEGLDPSAGGSGIAGLNSWGEMSYGGPCPPSGTHRYFFKLFALDEPLIFTSAPTWSEIQDAMKGHILGEAELMGLYSRED
jgi:Raf kinase inhibitor-like YbhB/YbcL family protein